jgi:hypothetical protein
MIHGLLWKIFSLSQTAFETSFGVTGDFRKAGTSSLMRVTGRTFTIIVVSDFIKSKQKLFLIFCTKRKPLIVKIVSTLMKPYKNIKIYKKYKIS